MIGLLVALGCSVEKHYKTLSLFFDGVPDPNAPQEGRRDGSGLTRGPRQGLIFFNHKPFFDGECSQCHGSGSGPMIPTTGAKVRPGLCLECHQTIENQYPFMHGPVAAQACTQCHAPHRSTVPKLLKAVPEELCFNCHDGRELNPAVAEHQAQTDCTRCHNGHGGSTWAMLKPLPPEPTEPDATPGATPDATPDATPQAMPDTAPEAAPATTEGGEQAGGTP